MVLQGGARGCQDAAVVILVLITIVLAYGQAVNCILLSWVPMALMCIHLEILQVFPLRPRFLHRHFIELFDLLLGSGYYPKTKIYY